MSGRIANHEVVRLIDERGLEEAALELHRRLRGKVQATPKAPLTEETLELLYTPGVGAVSRALADDDAAAGELTGRGNAVAVVSGGSAVLRLVEELGLEARGDVRDVVDGADILIGRSVPEAFTVDDVAGMADDAIVLALANPEPEVVPDEAARAGAAVVCTGRSDFPNQVNNVLAFPGLFRGALDGGLREVDEAALRRAAQALADLVDEPDAEHVLPKVLDDRVVPAVADAVAARR